jgi:hypothetical protein
MKTLARFVSLAALVVPAVALGQYSPAPSRAPANATRSILKPADEVEWAGYASSNYASAGYTGGTIVGDFRCCDKPIGCTSVCVGYDNCCPPRGPFCCLKRIARMLDCLLPCNKCCTSEPFCLFGHCKPHLFAGGHCFGGRGGCKTLGCTSCTSSCDSCSSPIGHPTLSDPFQDDPLPPKPMVDPAHGSRTTPAPIQTYAAPKSSPYKVTTGSPPAAPARKSAPVKSTAPDKYAGHSGIREVPTRSTESTTVRRASAHIEAAPTPPNLLPTSVRRASAEVAVEEVAIPVNPLRR